MRLFSDNQFGYLTNQIYNQVRGGPSAGPSADQYSQWPQPQGGGGESKFFRSVFNIIRSTVLEPDKQLSYPFVWCQTSAKLAVHKLVYLL